ncbi:hypothetical protein DRE_03857 [Drechslerella stenobrocha 248]|uniref:Exosome complex protein n=1 Tax=Drechslerella stenobrocha 248 TaxID=1043628 RepID=W7ICJ6_9PEZI|nr:hypothetical protein DRE_03857 [Drechslerella stenobrocha 248]
MESELWPALDDLDDSIESVSEALKPLLEQNLPKNASTLPLFDKAKLYILTTYALESLLFSYLSLSSAASADHPIMKELTRIRQYFQKVRDIENKDKAKEESKRADTRDNLTLDKAAAGRFISAALAGNDKYDEERAENTRLQKERAQEKFVALGEGVKDPVGERASDSDSSEEGGVRLVVSESENETAKPEVPQEDPDGNANSGNDSGPQRETSVERRKRKLEERAPQQAKKSKTGKSSKKKRSVHGKK